MFRLFLSLLLSVAYLRAQLPAETAAAVDQLVKKALTDSGTPAVSIAIVRDGKVALAKAYGDARLEPKTAALAGMRFSIGSVSKQFMAGALLMAQQDGKLSLDDKVARFIPGLTRARDVTVRQLLSHTSGYQDYYPQDYVAPFMLEPVTAQGILDRWANKPLDFEPGTQWQYSNTGFVAAGVVLEKATGTPAFEFLRQRIFGPLGMKTIQDLDHQPLTKEDASGYIRYAVGPLHPVTPEAPGWLFAAGELAMTAGDLALWDVALMDGTLLSPQSFTQMTTPVRLKNGATEMYGLGIGVGNSFGHLRLSHGGAVSGFTSLNTIWPDLKTAVVVLSNKDGSSAPGRITRELETLLLTPAEDPDSGRLLEQAKSIFNGLMEGRLDRSLFTSNCNAYFSPEAIREYASSLKALGNVKSFELNGFGMRGGFSERNYTVEFAGKTLRLVTRADAAGKLEQFQVSE